MTLDTGHPLCEDVGVLDSAELSVIMTSVFGSRVRKSLLTFYISLLDDADHLGAGFKGCCCSETQTVKLILGAIAFDAMLPAYLPAYGMMISERLVMEVYVAHGRGCHSNKLGRCLTQIRSMYRPERKSSEIPTGISSFVSAIIRTGVRRIFGMRYVVPAKDSG